MRAIEVGTSLGWPQRVHTQAVTRHPIVVALSALLGVGVGGCTSEAGSPAPSEGARASQSVAASPSRAPECGASLRDTDDSVARWTGLLGGTGQGTTDLAVGRSVGVTTLSTEGCTAADAEIVLADCPGADGWILSMPRALSGRSLAASGVIGVAASRTEVTNGPIPGTITAIFFRADSSSSKAYVNRWLTGCRASPEFGKLSVATLTSGVLAVRAANAAGVDRATSDRLLGQIRDRIAQDGQ